MSRSRVVSVLALAAIAALVSVAGCGRNSADKLLAPTGIRPRPAEWKGSVVGLVRYDPVNAPDLAAAPFPPTRVEAWLGDTTLVAFDSMSVDTTWFTLSHVQPGYYTIRVRSAMFHTAVSTGIHVDEGVADAGNLLLNVDPAASGSGMEIIGTMPGFRIADLQEGLFPLDVNELSASSLGIWNYSSIDYPDGQAIPAGTYHFKFATAFPATVTNMSGWGDPIGGTLTPPVVQHPAVLGEGSATDIVMNFPVSGVYSFTLDERRRTFSVQFLHALAVRSAGPARSARR